MITKNLSSNFWSGKMNKIKGNRIAFAYMIAILLFFTGGIINSGFLHFDHLINVLSLSSFLGFVVLAQSIVILSGKEGIDLSVGSIISLSTVVASQLMDGSNEMMIPAILVVLLLGFTLGLLTGSGIAFFKIPPLVMTLAMSSVIQGIALAYTQGQPKGKASDLLIYAGTGRILGFPVILVIWILFMVTAFIILERTKSGKILYGVGENPVTAELSGIRTQRVRCLTYGMSGMISAFAGICLLGYTGTSYLDLGSSYVMPSVAAAVIGGIALSGGIGSYIGAVAGTIVLTTLSSIMISLRSGEGGRKIVFGLVILFVLSVYSKRQKR